MKDCKFRLVYKGDNGFHFKKYHISEIGVGLSKICDIHNIMAFYAWNQYLGIKDINGVDICEGDIVHWGHIEGYEEINPRKAVVEINPDIQFKTFNLGDHNHTFKFGMFAYQNTHKALEVIGNIYQNPELLEG